MKKILILIIFILFNFNLYAMTKFSKKLIDYDYFNLNSSDFHNDSFYNELINKNNEIRFYYKIGVKDSSAFISEFYYIYINSKNERFLLGGYNKEKGFFNDKEITFTESNTEKKFRENYLLGISLFALRSPFSVQGIAMSTDGYIYKTEKLHSFIINPNTMSIEIEYQNY